MAKQRTNAASKSSSKSCVDWPAPNGIQLRFRRIQRRHLTTTSNAELVASKSPMSNASWVKATCLESTPPTPTSAADTEAPLCQNAPQSPQYVLVRTTEGSQFLSTPATHNLTRTCRNPSRYSNINGMPHDRQGFPFLHRVRRLLRTILAAHTRQPTAPPHPLSTLPTGQTETAPAVPMPALRHSALLILVTAAE